MGIGISHEEMHKIKKKGVTTANAMDVLCCAAEREDIKQHPNFVEEQDHYCFGAIHCNNLGDQWFVHVNIKGKDTKLKIDSRADISIISKEHHETLASKLLLTKVRRPLSSPSERLTPISCFHALVTHHKKKLPIHCFYGKCHSVS